MTMPGAPEGRMRTNEWGPSPQSQRTNPLAIAALICGIAEFIVLPAGIVAIVLGHKARRQIRQTGEAGRGLATAGLTLGYICLALIALWFVIEMPTVFAHLIHNLGSLL